MEMMNSSIPSNVIHIALSDEQTKLVILINTIILSGVISAFGTVTNIINMIVYYRQGLDTTINISFFSLALSDLGTLVFQQLYNIFMNPLFVDLDLPIMYSNIQFVTSSVPIAMFNRITLLITAFITAERCLCVVFPLHIKRIITTKVTAIFNISTFIITFLSAVPFYCTSHLEWKFFPNVNRTILDLTFTTHSDVTTVMSYFLQAFFSFAGFLIVLAFTLILTYKLRQKSAWRQTANVDVEKAKSMSKRDRATITMVVLNAAILVVCYTPAVLMCVTTTLVADFSAWGAYANVYFCCWSICLVFQTINSSVNIFLYCKLSSKFRNILASLCACACRLNNVREN